MTDISNNEIIKLDGALLLVFRELSRTRRGTEAASRLGVTQSYVSHSLDRLRELFADPLFIRRPHGFEPTRRALELGPRIDALLEIYGEALHRESHFDPALSDRRFAISAPESFFSSLKTERTARKTYRSRDEARTDVFDYVERCYNAQRRHSTLGYLSPIAFEEREALA